MSAQRLNIELPHQKFTVRHLTVAPPVGTASPAASPGAAPATPAGGDWRSLPAAGRSGQLQRPAQSAGRAAPVRGRVAEWPRLWLSFWCSAGPMVLVPVQPSVLQLGAVAVESLLAHTALLDSEIALVRPLRYSSNLFQLVSFSLTFQLFQLLLRRICFNTQMSTLTSTHLQSHSWKNGLGQ